MGLFLGFGVVAGTIATIGSFLVAVLPYVVLAAAFADKQKK